MGRKKLGSSWTTAIVFAVIIVAISAVAVNVGLYYAMPVETVAYDNAGFPVTIPFTDDFYNRSQMLMLVTILFPAGAYLMTYGGYKRLADEHPEAKERVKRGEFGRPWIAPLVILLAALVIYGLISVVMLYLGLGLQMALFADVYCLERYAMVYALAAVVELAMFFVGWKLFKPAVIQRA